MKTNILKLIPFICIFLGSVGISYSYCDFNGTDHEVFALEKEKYIKQTSWLYIDPEIEGKSTIKSTFSKTNSNTRGILHLFSHGRPGELLLGNRWLNAEEISDWIIQEHPEKKIQHINIYGCEFGKGSKGKRAVDFLSSKLNISISASDNITGIDGDWILEVGTYQESTEFLDYGYNLQCTGPAGDCDGDGITDLNDLDKDNDGILDADECGGSNRVSNGIFPTPLIGYNTNTVTGWTVGGTYSLVWNSLIGRVHLHSNGLEFRRDGGTVTTLSQALTGIHSYATITLNSLYWFRTLQSNSTGGFTFTVSYAGTIYATITSTTGGVAPTVVANNGATVNLTNLPGVATFTTRSAFSDLIITLPLVVPVNGNLLFTFTAGSDGTEVRDLGMRSVVVFSCRDTDGDGIPDFLDLDSDGDGCPDAIEGGGSFNYSDLDADTRLIGGVDSNGIPNVVSPVGQSIGSSRIATQVNIISQPNETTSVDGSNVTFTVNSSAVNSTTFAGGTPDFNIPPATNTSGGLIYQWQISTDIGSTWNNVSNGGAYSGATTNTLLITNPTLAYNGYIFRAVVTHTNFACETISEDATLYRILPVDWLKFEGKLSDNNQALLNWKTAKEKGSKHFIVHRSRDTRQWISIGQTSAQGNTDEASHYEFTDPSPLAGSNYYRLEQVDFDGKTNFSKVILVDFNPNWSVKVYPNPFTDEIFIQTKNLGEIQVSMMDNYGRTIFSNSCSAEDFPSRFETKNLQNGLYYLSIRKGEEKYIYKLKK